MPASYLRNLSSKNRQNHSDLSLARYLTFIAGAANAGGFLAINMYTSHMSGIVASIADSLILGSFDASLYASAALIAFMCGAASTAILVNWAHRNCLESVYAIPLLIEAGLLLAFGLIGSHIKAGELLFVLPTIMLLCFLMGLQNALITKISNARIRTTHITGMVTDIGIEIGKMCYWNRATSGQEKKPNVKANLIHLKTLSTLVFLFFLGGVIGAAVFKYIGFSFTYPLAILVALIGVIPAFDDIKIFLQRYLH